MNKRLFLSVLFCTVVCTAFAGGSRDSAAPTQKNTKTEPLWVNKPDTDYPAEQYFTAAGSGTTRSDAENNAVAAVGKILRQNISAVEQSQISVSTENTGLSTYLSNVQTSTSLKDISGITIKENWTAQDGTEYALAVLDRKVTGNYYSQKIDENSSKISELLKLVQSEQGTFKGCADIMQAYQLSKENDSYLELLSVIKPAFRELIMLPYTSSASVGAAAGKQFNTVTVVINVSGDDSGRISNALSSVLGGMGFKTMGGSSGGADDKVPYTLLCTVSFEPVTMTDSKYSFVRYIATTELIESATGKNILSWSKNGRAGKLSPDEARQAAVRALEADIQSEYSTAFNSILNAQ